MQQLIDTTSGIGLTFTQRYEQLEMEVIRSLRKHVKNSKYKSVHTGENAIKISVFDYTELSIINDQLTFLDEDGLHYSLYDECYLEDLISLVD